LTQSRDDRCSFKGMTMGEWRKTMCDLCPTGCGLEVQVEDNRIIKARGDRDNGRSQGYCCRKGLSIQYHQHAQRLTHPLKRAGDGFERISWDQALDEIAAKIRTIVEENGPDAVAYAGEPGAWGGLLMGALGSHGYYSSLAQELGGEMFVGARMLGDPGLGLATSPDYDETDLLLAIGWNGAESNMAPQAGRYLRAFSKDPDKILVVVDPRRSETARLADIHLPIRPGTDALLTKSMISIILQEGWQDQEYIARHTNGFGAIQGWFAGFDVKAALEVCELDHAQVREVCRLFATRKSSLKSGLGIEMSRHSTATSYLEVILKTVCGRVGVRGGNVVHGGLLHTSAPAPEPGAPLWRTPATGYFPIMGMLPPNILPEEILSDGPDRLRALIVCAANPLRSWADTRAYEEAFKDLELLVTIDMAATETAAASDYVLPARSCFESWGGILPTIDATFPGIYHQLRRPVVEPGPEVRETLEILVQLADRLGLTPPIPEALVKAAEGDRVGFAGELLAIVKLDPRLEGAVPFIVAKTLGKAMGSVRLADIWFKLFTAPDFAIGEMAQVGFHPGPGLADEVLAALIDHPEGTWTGRSFPEHNLAALSTPDKCIELLIPELTDWVKGIDAASEAESLRADPEYPLVLMAGSHIDITANTQLRDPAWNKSRRVSTMSVNPRDAESLGLVDGQQAKVTTEAGSVEIEVEVTDAARAGQVIIPQGFGLTFEGETYGVNVNLLTKNTHRDRIAGTPHHRYVPCRVEGL
jgi:anaerobic selenocysteine-containing dehydrogenase